MWIYIVKRAQSANKGGKSALKGIAKIITRAGAITLLQFGICYGWTQAGKAKGAILKNYRAIFEAITLNNIFFG